MTKVEIIRYEIKYQAAVLELQRRLWNPSLTVNKQYFDWKFIDNPHAQFGEIFLAISNDRLVGMRGFMGTLWISPSGTMLPIPLAGDTVIAADYEGHGIVTRLSNKGRDELTSRGIHFILNTSASPMVFWHSYRSGWKIVGQYAQMRRRHGGLHWGRQLQKRLQRIGFFAATAVTDPFANSDGAHWSAGRKTIVSLRRTPDPERFAELCESLERPSKYSLVRDTAFFRWRFNNPLRKYYFMTCRRGSALIAYLALSVQERAKGADVRIVDWAYREWAAFRILLDTLARRFPHVPLSMLVNALTDVERLDLVDAGFQEIIFHRGTPSSQEMKFKPGPLVVPAASQEAAQGLVEEGFGRLEFKGIESDGA